MEHQQRQWLLARFNAIESELDHLNAGELPGCFVSPERYREALGDEKRAIELLLENIAEEPDCPSAAATISKRY